jgi:hypothetical protein
MIARQAQKPWADVRMEFLKDKETRMRLTGLERFGLDMAAFRRLENRKVLAYIYLRTYDVTPAIQRLPCSKRQPYMAARVNRWIEDLYRLYPELSFQMKGGKPSATGARRWSELPTTLTAKGPARKILALAGAAGVASIYVTRITGCRSRRSPKVQLEWYCVRAFVVIRVERARSGMQNTEDRFMLVRASSFEDAKKRLRQQWQEYATPYLSSEGQMVSWHLDRVVDVYHTSETDIDPIGTEVYSKLGHRRMRPQFIWRPRLRG